jgi:hypothetical protein
MCGQGVLRFEQSSGGRPIRGQTSASATRIPFQVNTSQERDIREKFREEQHPHEHARGSLISLLQKHFELRGRLVSSRVRSCPTPRSSLGRAAASAARRRRGAVLSNASRATTSTAKQSQQLFSALQSFTTQRAIFTRACRSGQDGLGRPGVSRTRTAGSMTWHPRPPPPPCAMLSPSHRPSCASATLPLGRARVRPGYRPARVTRGRARVRSGGPGPRGVRRRRSGSCRPRGRAAPRPGPPPRP